MGLRIGWAGLELGDAEAHTAIMQEFTRARAVRLPGFLRPDVLAACRAELGSSGFKPRSFDGMGSELLVVNPRLTTILQLLMNDPRLHATLRAVAGCPPIGCFSGRIFRSLPGGDHELGWHDDLVQDRLLALSINLGDGFEGGVLQLRERGSERVLFEGSNTVAGDAMLFQIAPDLEHRVSGIEGANPRTAFAGWFREKPAFADLLEQDSTTRATRGVHVASIPFRGGLLLEDLATGEMLHTNEVGKRVWELMAGHRDVEEILPRLELEFDAPPALLAENARAFVAELRGRALIRDAPARPTGGEDDLRD